ncbi:MAG: hypothetical protein A2103_04265 [Gammaproteobacteria bacterium GWF2_41_13]|nr:MAG: hypothetical protein A2103_04265 [Gammaproteobacteria bacterium GWF2_41_13]
MRKCNIGLVLSLSRYGGGTYQWTINILHVLEDYRKAHPEEIQIHIFCPTQNKDNKDNKDNEDNEEIRRVFPCFQSNQVSKVAIFFTKAIIKIFIAMPFLLFFLRYIFPLNFIAAKKKVDLMIFPGASFDAALYWGEQIFMFTDIAHIFYPHFPEVSSNGELRRRHLLFNYGIKQATQVVVDSNQLRLDVGEYYHANLSKINVLYQTRSQTLNFDDNSDDCVQFKNILPKKYLFYPAQLWEHKNHKNLLLAMKIVLEADNDVFLILSGAKKEGSEKIFSLIENLNIPKNVKYLGYVTDQFMPILYKNALMLVMPTYFGPTNIPTLEAFYFGCPAVISDLPGVREQTGKAALLFDPDSPEDIANKIQLVLQDKTRREEMVKMGYERMKLFSYEKYRTDLFSILDKSLKIGVE